MKSKRQDRIVHLIAEHIIETQDELIAKNGPQRCYYCKKRIFSAIREAACKDGYTLLCDGARPNVLVGV